MVLLLGVNERHALDKTAFSCISLFAGAFTNACRMHAGACTLSKFVKRIYYYGVLNECAFIHFFFGGAFGMHAVVRL